MVRDTGIATPPGVATSSRQRRLILVTVALSLMMVVSAVSGLNVALPDLARDTGATQSQLQWIVDAYTVVFAGLLLFAGALGDRLGRRPLLIGGLIVFGAAAALGMVVDQPNALIWVRAAMGIGAAAVMPTTLAVISTAFPPQERGRAVGLWVGVAGGGAVIGLFAAGLLLEWFPWSSFFGLNVALAVIALVLAIRVVPQSLDEHPPSLDLPSGVLSLVGVAALVFGIIEGPVRGWSDGVTVAALVVGLASIVGFVLRQLGLSHPLLDPRLFARRGFGTGTLSVTVQFFSAFGFFFILMQYLQFVVGRSPLGAAAALLPLPVVLIPLARRTPGIAASVGFHRTGALGLTLIAAGMFTVSTLDVELNAWVLTGGLILFGMGMAFAGAPATTAIIAALPRAKQGVASSVNDLSREFGSALGIAVLGSVLNNAYRAGVDQVTTGLPDPVREAVQGNIAFVDRLPADTVGPRAAQVIEGAKLAFLDGVGGALRLACVVLLITALVIGIFGPRAAQMTGAAERSDAE